MKFFDSFLKPNKYGMFGLNNLGTEGKLYQNVSDPGSMLFGGAGERNSLGMRRDGTKGGFFGDKAQGIDYFGSPVSAGTNLQGGARLAAIIYGLAAGGAAAMGGGAGGAAGGGAAGGGAAGGGAAGGGAAGGGAGGTITYGGGGATSASAAPTAGASSSPAWMNYARMGSQAANSMNQRKPYEPKNETFGDDEQNAQLLAALLRRG